MTAFGRPGVFIQENTVPQNIVIQDRSDAIAGFVGALPKGPTTATFVNNWASFVKNFGNLDFTYPTSVAAYQFFANGGRDAYIKRATSSTAATASVQLNNASAAAALTVSAINPGSWGNTLSVEALTYGPTANNRFSIVVYGQPYTSGSNSRSNIIEQFNDLSASSTDPRYVGTIINNTSAYVKVTVGSGAPVVDGVLHPLTSGTDVSIATTDIVSALAGFDTINTPLIINAPDLAYVGSTSVQGNFARADVISANASIVKYCEYRGDAFAVIDTPNLNASFDAINFISDVSNNAATSSPATISASISTVTPSTQGSTSATGYVTYTTSASHNFVAGQTVTISGITSSSALNTTGATAIQPATPSTGYVTYTTATAHGLKTGDLVTIAGITGTVGTNYNVATPTAITVTSTTSFYISSAVAGATSANTVTTSATVGSTGYAGSYTIWSTPNATQFVTANAETATPVLSTASASVPVSTNPLAWTAVSATGANAAAYYPWLNIPDTTKNAPAVTVTVPPGGAIVGKYQQTDALDGVFKSPAGYGTRVALATSLSVILSNNDLDNLNSAAVSVNSLRVVPGSGVVVMGARTMSSTAANRYINMRRTLIYLKKELTARTNFAVFQNNDAFLWNSINNSLKNFLGGFWQQGGLRGATPAQAFYVKCDSSTNSQADIANGRVNIQVGVSLEYPAEYVLITIGQFTGGTPVTQG